MPALILASSSPRRSQLLREWGYTDFQVLAADVEEAHDASLSCQQLTEENALLKALAVARDHADALVIGADTLVYVDDEPLGKPRDMEEARTMLRRLSGRTHQVCTGVALVAQGGAQRESFSVITEVSFLELTEESISAYHAAVPVLDKAGGYALQDHGDWIVAETRGSQSNVVGLPMEELIERLRERGL